MRYLQVTGIGFKELPDPSSAQCSTCSRIGKRLLASSLPIEQQDVEDCPLALMILRDLSVRYDTKHLLEINGVGVLWPIEVLWPIDFVGNGPTP
jgi:hypothetical protein